MARIAKNPPEIVTNLPGSFRKRSNRWTWTVTLPGDNKPQTIRLKPVGADYATHDPAVAVQIAQNLWNAALAAASKDPTAGPIAFNGTVAALADAYVAYAHRRFRRGDGTETTSVGNIELAMRPLQSMMVRAESFGPLALQKVRKTWEESKLCRTTINDRVRIIQDAFKWGASQELVPRYLYDNLTTIVHLHKGASLHGATEPRKVGPVPVAHVRATEEFLTPTLKAMVSIHLLTGMRSTEVCCLKPCYIDRSNKDAWIYNVPDEANKNAHREGDEHKRRIPLVGKVQEILTPFLLRAPDAYCFTPEQSEKERNVERRKNRKTLGVDGQVWPSHLARYNLKRRGRMFAERYNKGSYRLAIRRATNKANKALERKMKKDKATAEQIAKAMMPNWHPHQLRHTAATLVRKALGSAGLDAARALLGQKDLAVAEIYAEVDQSLAIQAAKMLA